MKQNKAKGAGKEEGSPAVRRNCGIFFTLLNAWIPAGRFPHRPSFCLIFFGHDSFALAFSYTPFIFLLYAAEQKEYRQEGKRAALLTVPNVWKSLVMYTLLILLSLLLPFCGYIDGTEASDRLVGRG